MPRIPQYQPNQVRPVEAVDTRFRAANDGGGVFGALGEGAQRLGIALDKYATVEDGIQDKFDDTYSRQLALEYQAGQSPILTQYGSQQGKGAIDLAAPTQEQIKKLRDDTLAKASNPRMRRYLEERLAEPFTKAMSTVTGHSLQQQVVMAENTALSEQALAVNEAIGSADNPALAAKAKDKALAAHVELSRIKGYDDKTSEAKKLELTTKIHVGVVDAKLAQTNPDVLLVQAYAAAHRDEMTSTAYTGIMKDLQAPMQERTAEADFRGAVAGAPAEAATSGAAPAPVPGTYNPAGLKSKIRGPESNGDDNARNRMGSSASGRYQFVEGTFKDVWGKVYGAGADEAWQTKRFDPAVQEKLMDRLMADNAKALAGVAPVTDGNMYVMHVLGSGDGPKLLKASADTPVASLLSPAIVRQNPSYFGGGKTVSQSLAIIRGKVGDASSVNTNAPRTWDKDVVYNLIEAKAKAEGWDGNFERVERAKRRADKEIAMDEQLDRRQKDAADETAEEIVTTKADGFTSINMIPSEIRANMTPTLRAKYEKLAEENRQPKEVKSNGPDANVLRAMMDSKDPDFVNMKLSDYQNKVSREEYQSFVAGQAKAKREPPDAWSPYSGVNTALTTVKRLNPGVALDDDDLARITIDMAAAAKEAKAAGKPIDYDALARQYTRKVVINKTGMFGGVTPSSVPIYDVGMENIPEAKRTEISKFLTSRLRRKPTDDEIIATFRQTYNFQSAP